MSNIDMNKLNEYLLYASKNNHLDIIKHVLYNIKIDIDCSDYFINAIRYNNIKIAEYLILLKNKHIIIGIDVIDINHNFKNIYKNNNINIIKYILSKNDKLTNNILFVNLCGYNHHINSIKYTLSNYKIDIHYNNDAAFNNAVTNNCLKIVKYLISLSDEYGKINIHVNNDYLFTYACKEKYIILIKYLVSLETEYGKIDKIRGINCLVKNKKIDIIKYLVKLDIICDDLIKENFLWQDQYITDTCHKYYTQRMKNYIFSLKF